MHITPKGFAASFVTCKVVTYDKILPEYKCNAADVQHCAPILQ